MKLKLSIFVPNDQWDTLPLYRLRIIIIAIDPRYLVKMAAVRL